jgi:hypothetical protein
MTVNIVNVFYKFIGEAHFFTSYDQEAIGLCVAHNDLEKAFFEVSEQLNKLFEYNHDKKVSFSPVMKFEKFKEFIDTQLINDDHCSILLSWEYS